uniref:Uncharacterized protein n=1 Tax=Arundo donax TaxID=35708 RepID=A0A0A9TCZ3_ARUDO
MILRNIREMKLAVKLHLPDHIHVQSDDCFKVEDYN